MQVGGYIASPPGCSVCFIEQSHLVLLSATTAGRTIFSSPSAVCEACSETTGPDADAVCSIHCVMIYGCGKWKLKHTSEQLSSGGLCFIPAVYRRVRSVHGPFSGTTRHTETTSLDNPGFDRRSRDPARSVCILPHGVVGRIPRNLCPTAYTPLWIVIPPTHPRISIYTPPNAQEAVVVRIGSRTHERELSHVHGAPTERAGYLARRIPDPGLFRIARSAHRLIRNLPTVRELNGDFKT